MGPKIQEQLRATAPDMNLAVDYGVLGPLARGLFWVLAHIYDWVGNWGWAIIICTFLIKLAFYKLTAMSGRSMAKMRKIAPRMKAIQERFKDDRQGLSQAMMELYKREKVNPAAGCLPMLVQMPFLFAFYWVLVESVELRQAPFMLWIDDLSKRDPFFVLPILMGAAMLLQMRLSPAPPDPVQARVMQIMPIIFTVMFAFFPAGLVMYWLTSTVLGSSSSGASTRSSRARADRGANVRPPADDTIAALATAPGTGAIAILRISGPDARSIAERVLGRVPAAARRGALRAQRSRGRGESTVAWRSFSRRRTRTRARTSSSSSATAAPSSSRGSSRRSTRTARARPSRASSRNARS